MNTLTFLLLATVVVLSFSVSESYAFDPQVFNVTLNDAQTQEFDGYDIISLNFTLYNTGSEDITLSGFNTIYLNDTNGDYWESINNLDFELTESECPLLDIVALANSTNNIKLCFLTTDEENLGYSLVIEDDDYFSEYQAQDLILESVPDWFKTTVASWCSNAISESQFTTLVQSNIQDGTINVLRGQSGLDVGTPTPEWIKGNSCLWSSDQISDYEFLDGIYWFIDNGKIQLN